MEVELALAGDSYDDFFSISFSGEGVETNMEIHNDDGIEFDLNVTFHTEDLIDYIVSDTSTDNIKTSLVNYFVNNEFSDDFEFFFGLNNLELSDTTTIIEADGDYYKKTVETNYALFSGITAEIEPGEGSVQTALNAVSSKVQFLMHSEDTDYYPDADCKEGEEIEGMSVYSLSELAVNGFVGTLAVTKDKGAYAELTVPNFDVTYVGQNGDVSTQAIMTVYNAGMKFWVDKVPQVQELSFSNILGTVMPFLLEGINGCIYCSYAEFQVIQNDGGDVSEYNGILGDQLSTDKYIDIDIKVKAQMQPDFTPALVDSGITLKTLGSPFLVVTEKSTGLGVTFLDVSANIPLAINKDAEGMTDLIVIDPSARVLIGTYFVSETGGVVPFQLDGISIPTV